MLAAVLAGVFAFPPQAGTRLDESVAPAAAWGDDPPTDEVAPPVPPPAPALEQASADAPPETLPGATTAFAVPLESEPEQIAGPVQVPGPEQIAGPEQAPESEGEARPAYSRFLRQRIRPGDNLAKLFSSLNIPARDLQAILDVGGIEDGGDIARRLRDIMPGESLSFTWDAEKRLALLEYAPGPLETFSFIRGEDNTFRAEQVRREPERVLAYRHGTIDHSLYKDGRDIGLDRDVIMRLAGLFQWDIDFALDLRKGDEFHLLVHELRLGDLFIGFGDILSAEFVNRGRSYRAVRYVASNGTANHYTPDGDNLRRAFIRTPVDFTRISSNFNLKRIHPLWKSSMPHRGVDYAAPRGTEVLAAGDGKVVTAGRTKPNGNFIVLQHGEQFQTKYLHLSRFAKNVRRGKRVRQGQVIGYVGSTGWATGPHLHYEFLVNGVHKNPRTVRLPKALPIPSSERSRFEAEAAPLLKQLEEMKTHPDIAAETRPRADSTGD